MTARAIFSIRVGARHRKDMGDLDALAASIREVGLLHPIVVTPEGLLIAGERRLAACNRLGWTEIPVTTVAIEEIVRGEFAENAIRKDFLPSEIEAIRRTLLPKQKEAAAERRRDGQRAGGHVRQGSLVENAHQAAAGKTRDKIATFANISGRTVEKIAKVVDVACPSNCHYSESGR